MGAYENAISESNDPKVLRGEIARLTEAAKTCIDDLDMYRDWARSRGRINSELQRIGKQLRAAIGLEADDA